jgi:tRNA A37 threonylcarbamoyladenosine dehydratase
LRRSACADGVGGGPRGIGSHRGWHYYLIDLDVLVVQCQSAIASVRQYLWAKQKIMAMGATVSEINPKATVNLIDDFRQLNVAALLPS